LTELLMRRRRMLMVGMMLAAVAAAVAVGVAEIGVHVAKAMARKRHLKTLIARLNRPAWTWIIRYKAHRQLSPLAPAWLRPVLPLSL
jgi:hypothetical protein